MSSLDLSDLLLSRLAARLAQDEIGGPKGSDRHKRKVPRRDHPSLEFLNPEPWAEPVPASALLQDLTTTITNYVAMPEPLALAVSLWAMHTHILDVCETTPRLVITSSQRACGKSALLNLLSQLVARPLDFCGADCRGILWSLGYWPTLLMDDPSVLLAGREMRAVLRNGRRRKGGCFIRRVDRNVRRIDIFTAAAIAVDGNIPPMLGERCIEICLDPLKPGETVQRIGSAPDERLSLLARRMHRWAADTMATLREADASRAAMRDEHWAPLLMIAAVAGPEWEERARAAMQLLRPKAATHPLEMLLADIQVLLQQHWAGELVLPSVNGGKPVTDRDRIRSADLARLLGSMEGQPWCEWGKTAQPITPHTVARILSQAHIRPAPLRFHTGDNNGPGPVMIDKGYLHAQFTEAFERYLPA
jgi:hypothetical protein